MLYLKRLEGIIFCLVIFSISIQLGKHFWPDFAFVSGIRLDYLSPTLYISDIFITLFIGLHFFLSPKDFLSFISKTFIFPLFLLSILASSIFAIDFDSSIYWSLKIIEMILFGWAVYSYKLGKSTFLRTIDVLVVAAVAQSVIAISQFLFQRSIGGMLYFLGERSFDLQTIGISTFISSGKELLRPYGTFPHPNVLAMFLSIALLFLIFYIYNNKSSIRSYIYSFASVLIFLGLLATSSRVIIILTVLFALSAFIRSKKHLLYAMVLTSILLPGYLLIFSGRFLTLGPLIDAFMIRADLLRVNITLLNDNLLLGVGLNNTFLNSSTVDSLPIYARFQPVHNIYLHILLQIGLLGGISILFFLIKVVKRINYAIHSKKFPLVISAILSLEILILGFFDHFPVTLQQGMMMTVLVLGLLFNDSMEQE